MTILLVGAPDGDVDSTRAVFSTEDERYLTARDTAATRHDVVYVGGALGDPRLTTQSTAGIAAPREVA